MEFMNVKQFSAESDICKDLTESVKKYAAETIKERKGVACFSEGHTKAEMKELINKAFAECVAEKSGFALPKEGASKMEIQRYSENPLVKTFAEQTRNILIDAIIPDFIIESPLQYIADVQMADLGDTIKFDIKSNSLFTVSKAGNRQRTTNQQKTFRTTVTMTGDNHEITVGTTLFEVLTGQSYLAEEVMKVARSIETAMLFDAYDAFTAEMGTLSGNLQVQNYSEKSLISLCETVTAYNQGRKAVILGTPVALKAVLPAVSGAYRYILDDEYVKMGHLPVFNTYDVLPMEQVANPYAATPYSLKLDDTKIYVVSPASDKIVKLGVFGGTFSHQNDSYDNANLSIEHTVTKSWNTAVVTNSVGGIVTNLG